MTLNRMNVNIFRIFNKKEFFYNSRFKTFLLTKTQAFKNDNNETITKFNKLIIS